MRIICLGVLILILITPKLYAQPEIKIYFGKHENGAILTKNEALQVDSITVESSVYKDSNLVVTRFDFIYKPLKLGALHIKGNGSHITAEMKSALDHVNYGDKIMITNIYCIIPMGGERKLGKGIILTIKPDQASPEK